MFSVTPTLFRRVVAACRPGQWVWQSATRRPEGEPATGGQCKRTATRMAAACVRESTTLSRRCQPPAPTCSDSFPQGALVARILQRTTACRNQHESAKVGHRAGRTGSSTKCHDGVPPWKDGSPASLHREVPQGRKHCAYSSLSSRGEGRRNCTILSAYAKQRQRKTSYKQKAGKRAPAGTLLTKALGRNNPAMEAALRRRLRLPLPLQLLRPQPRGDHALACGGCWLAERKSWSGPGCA